MLTKVKDVVAIVVLVLMAYVVGTVALHIQRWSKAADLITVHTDKTVGEIALAAKNMNASSISTKESADLLNKRLPGLLDKLDGTVGKTNTLLDTLDGTAHEITTSVQAANLLIRNTDNRLAEADAKLDAAIGHATIAIDSASGLLQSGQTYINGPLTGLTTEAHDTLVPVQMGAEDFQKSLHSWLYPAKQSRIMRLYKFGKGIAGFAQPAYYTIKIARDN